MICMVKLSCSILYVWIFPKKYCDIFIVLCGELLYEFVDILWFIFSIFSWQEININCWWISKKISVALHSTCCMCYPVGNLWQIKQLLDHGESALGGFEIMDLWHFLTLHVISMARFLEPVVETIWELEINTLQVGNG